MTADIRTSDHGLTGTGTPSGPESRAPWWRRAAQFVGERPELGWAVAAFVCFVLALVLQVTGAPSALWIGAYAVCYAAGGWEPAWSGLQELRKMRLDVDVLMVVAAIAAATIGQWRDGGLLIVIFATSGALESMATRRTETGVRALMKLAPEEATRLGAGGREERVASGDLVAGDVVVVRPGERIATDGEVIEGSTDVDESSITGEAVPVSKVVGEEVFAGTMNGTGAIKVRATRPGSETVIARIASLVEEAQEAKAPTQLFIERFEQRYSVGVVVTTILFIAIPIPLLGWSFEEALLRAMTFMIVASPCAVVLATMPPLLSAIASATRAGVLVKGGVPMERLAGIREVAFDKTGTLTEGTPVVTEIVAFDGDEEGLLALAAAGEEGSEHPLGRAILTEALERSLVLPEVTAFQALPGRGIEATVDGRVVRIGSRRLVTPSGEAEAALAELEQKGLSALAVESDGVVIGALGMADVVRPDALRVVAELARIGVVRTSMVTGDHAGPAEHAARATEVGQVKAGLLPEDKVAHVRDLGSDEGHVMFVGDGVNDSPALAAADIGVAMGMRGTDAALETADVILVRDRLSVLPELIELSRRANRLVRQNLVFALTVIVLLVTLDVLGRLPLPIAVAGHESSSILVALNGLCMLRWRFRGADAPTPAPTRSSHSLEVHSG
ncbi:MAG: cadmium-translocating P-type ATPase [Propionibacteriales bacterium]|nr:cadmium-translocating P-type ATPase [Propionibacteriales bacterium]